MGRSSNSLPPSSMSALLWLTSRKRVFYERVTGVKVCFWVFPFVGLLLLLLLGSRRMLFSTGFLFALLVSLSEARCRLGFSRRIDAAIYRPALALASPHDCV